MLHTGPLELCFERYIPRIFGLVYWEYNVIISNKTIVIEIMCRLSFKIRYS